MSTAEGWPLPAALVAQVERFYAEGATPAIPRVAATVMLLRPAPGGGFQVYAIRRASTMAFASGMVAFPGGGVDARDATGELAWTGPSDVEWSRRLGQPPGPARAIVAAAVRELFEESGVLLADARDVAGDRWEAARRALVSRERSLTEVLAERRLALRGELLAPWARWITPEFEPRRFDTYFFVAALPDGQDARDVSGEADATMWLRPRAAVDGFRDGTVAMLPPTAVALTELAGYASIAEVFAAAAGRDAAAAVIPRVVRGTDGWHRLVP